MVLGLSALDNSSTYIQMKAVFHLKLPEQCFFFFLVGVGESFQFENILIMLYNILCNILLIIFESCLE